MLTPYSAVVAYTPIMEMVTSFVRLSVDSVLLLLSVVAIKRRPTLIVTVAVTDGQARPVRRGGLKGAKPPPEMSGKKLK